MRASKCEVHFAIHRVFFNTFPSVNAFVGSRRVHVADAFALDYPAMRLAMAPIREEILRHAMHPRNLAKARDDWLLLS
jgi:hypothetical protein